MSWQVKKFKKKATLLLLQQGQSAGRKKSPDPLNTSLQKNL